MKGHFPYKYIYVHDRILLLLDRGDSGQSSCTYRRWAIVYCAGVSNTFKV